MPRITLLTPQAHTCDLFLQFLVTVDINCIIYFVTAQSTSAKCKMSDRIAQAQAL